MKKSFVHYPFSRSNHEAEGGSQDEKVFDSGAQMGSYARNRAPRGNNHRRNSDESGESPREKLRHISNMKGSIQLGKVYRLEGLHSEVDIEAHSEDGSSATPSSHEDEHGWSRDADEIKVRIMQERRQQKRAASHDRKSGLDSEKVDSVMQSSGTLEQKGGNLPALSQEERDKEIKERLKPDQNNTSNHARESQGVTASRNVRTQGKPSAAMSQEEKDNDIKERLKRERREQRKVASSMRQSASHLQTVVFDMPKVTTNDQNNSCDHVGMSQGVTTSGEDRTQGNMRAAISQEEKDNEIKERLKRERREQRKVASSMRQSASHPQPAMLDISKGPIDDQNNTADNVGVSKGITTSGEDRTKCNMSIAMSQEEKDKEIKERLKRERREQRKVASSMRQSASHLQPVLDMSKVTTADQNNNSYLFGASKGASTPGEERTQGNVSTAMSQEEKDKEIKERLKRERREQRKVASSMRQSASHPQPVDLDTYKLTKEDKKKTPDYVGGIEGVATSGQDMTQGNMSTAASQEERDKAIKERLKRERREQRKVASSMRQSSSHPQCVLDMSKLTPEDQNNKSDNVGLSEGLTPSGEDRTKGSRSSAMSQEERDKEIKERLKRERREQRKMASSIQQSSSHLKHETGTPEGDAFGRIDPLSTPNSQVVDVNVGSVGTLSTWPHNTERRSRDTESSSHEIYGKGTYEEMYPNKHRSHHKKTQKQKIFDGHADKVIDDTMIDKSKSRRAKRVDQTSCLIKALGATADVDDDLTRRIAEKMREKQFSKKKNRSHKLTRKDTSEINMQSEDRRKSIAAWTDKYDLRRAVILAEKTPEMDWLSSFYRCDPRWQILKFFNEVAREGGDAKIDEDLASSPLSHLFDKANVFTVWRPTSDEAIKNMMLGIATGKGLDIKGKSAKRGNISSYVPFIQVYTDQHKEQVRTLIKDGRTIRLFYQTEDCRKEAHEMIVDIKDYMRFAAEDAIRVLSDAFASPAEQDLAMKHLMYDETKLVVENIDTYINSCPPVYGLSISERLFWEAYVMMQDCSRPAGTEWDIGRGSELNFMEMNFKTMRHEPKPGDACPVVFQMSTSSPMEPRTLLVAYEENGKVKPVVSDFDCFLTGTRGVKYKQTIPKDQVELLKWSVDNISEVLDERVATQSTKGWMDTWFNVLKKAALKGFYPQTPKYGNGDPTSYKIIEVAVSRLSDTGCVRHGAECFNFFFPQDIDDTLLIISDTLPGNVKWKKVNEQQLQSILMDKIDEGFTFRKTPDWVLCDPGWRRVYDKLLASQLPNVQDSLNCWLPPDTGLRQKIDEVSRRHPHGFYTSAHKSAKNTEGTELMDMMEDQLQRYMKIQRAWRKLRLALFWIRFVREKRASVSQLKRL
eukprot:CCRYP_018550-RA/>CCRYP_018550-RA protein AED:0.08 eAED:0.08 QI:140/0.91/0.92/1/0.5/0.30/13/434/1368